MGVREGKGWTPSIVWFSIGGKSILHPFSLVIGLQFRKVRDGKGIPSVKMATSTSLCLFTPVSEVKRRGQNVGHLPLTSPSMHFPLLDTESSLVDTKLLPIKSFTSPPTCQFKWNASHNCKRVKYLF